MNMTTQREAFENWYATDDAFEWKNAKDAQFLAWQAALSQPNEPYKYELSYDNEHGRCYEYFDADSKERAYLWAKEVYQNCNPKVVELFISPPNTSGIEIIGYQRLAADDTWVDVHIDDIPYCRDNRGQKIRTIYAQKSAEGEYF